MIGMIRPGELELRREELMKQAENERLANLARKHERSPLLANLGRQLIGLGERMQHQTERRPMEAGRRLKPQW